MNSQNIVFAVNWKSGGQDFHEVRNLHFEFAKLELSLTAFLRRSGFCCRLCRLGDAHRGWTSTASPSAKRVSRLGSSARLSYLPTETIRIRLKDLCVLEA